MIRSLNTRHGTVVLRPARLADASNFRELRLGALRENPTAFGMDYQKATGYPDKYWEDMMNMDEDESAIFLAVHDAQLIGMAGIMRGRSPKTKHAAEIWGVYVSSEWRGLHIAEELIKSCTLWAEAHGIVIMRLAVVVTNQPAVRCYERCGFVTYGIEPRSLLVDGTYYDEYLMSLVIGN